MLAGMSSQNITEWRAYFKAKETMSSVDPKAQQEQASQLPVGMGT